ncbi:MAG: two component signal transduction system histidine kinase [Bacteroidetes bacterium HLUCCA01]|nr:MAG: two component signal transduction system histidine kinase [Bacteroidetes bacterium HLUCCA01]
MKIRTKLSLTFISLLIFGVTAVSSYAIMFIRNYLLQEGQQTIQEQARWLALTIQEFPRDGQFMTRLNTLEEVSGYEITVYDGDGVVVYGEGGALLDDRDALLTDSLQMQVYMGDAALINERSNEGLYVFHSLMSPDLELGFLRVAQLKETIYEPITTIRWIIYSGMFISIAIILLVSTVFARYMSRPILRLKDGAQRIADGHTEHINLDDQSEEYAELARSINHMADQLRKDNERLAIIYEKQSQFFADITHEIRNPLHTINASMELLQVGGLDPEKQQKYIQNARTQAERIGALFKDLLTLQRYDSDQNFIQSQWFDLQRITTRLAALYEEEAQAKNLQIRIQQTSCRVLADAGKIEQVLDNLISNAIKYTASGEIGLRYEQQGKKVRIAVYDTGIGISEEHMPRLFDRFYRTDKARSRDKGGTGLGLSVVKSILDAHGAAIHVESKPGTGTSFWFELTTN